MTLLVVAAWEPELERFRTLAAEAGLAPRIGGVGIGLVDAALGAARLLERERPTALLLLGTCGAAPGAGLAIGDVIVATRVALADPATLEGRAALPWTPAAIEPAGDPSPFVAAGARTATNATTLGITTDDALAQRLAGEAATEHLEAYAVARAAETAGVPATILLGITNVVGARGRDEWRANHLAVSAAVAKVAVAGLVRTSTTARSPG